MLTMSCYIGPLAPTSAGRFEAVTHTLVEPIERSAVTIWWSCRERPGLKDAGMVPSPSAVLYATHPVISLNVKMQTSCSRLKAIKFSLKNKKGRFR
jgi:hypothetical protein